jgi:hypothetical protein
MRTAAHAGNKNGSLRENGNGRGSRTLYAYGPSEEDRLQDAKRHAERNPGGISLRTGPMHEMLPAAFLPGGAAESSLRVL